MNMDKGSQLVLLFCPEAHDVTDIIALKIFA